MRPIDADSLKKAVYRSGIDNQADILTLIEDQPTADVEEVVRCKDCKHGFNTERTTNILYCTRYILAICKPNDFCSYGERREG